MTIAVKEILALSVKERLAIIDQIWESLSEVDKDQLPVSENQITEIKRRRDLHWKGDVEVHTWEEVKSAIRVRKV